MGECGCGQGCIYGHIAMLRKRNQCERNKRDAKRSKTEESHILLPIKHLSFVYKCMMYSVCTYTCIMPCVRC